MSHPLVLGLFDGTAAASRGAAAVRALGVERQHLSIVARTHDEETQLARAWGGTPGADIEDSRIAARLGELGAQVLAAIALVMPGIGPIVASGPLSAELGEAVGHMAGRLATVLGQAGVDLDRAQTLEARVREGSVLLGVHVVTGSAEHVRQALLANGAQETDLAQWDG